jgi:hypothetical protein
MGAEQSNRHERPRKTRQPGQATVQINRTDPDLQEALEAYANVGLDPAIIERIIQDQERELANQISTPTLKNDDTQKKKSKEKKKEIQQEQSGEVNNQQQLDTKIRQPQPERGVNQKQKQQQYGEEQLREKSRQFNETAERVERIFLSKHQPNACVENEQVSSIINLKKMERKLSN